MPEHMSFPLGVVGEAAAAELTGQPPLRAAQNTTTTNTTNTAAAVAAAAAGGRRKAFWEMEFR